MEKTTQFTVKQTLLPGLLEIDITILADARGFFQEKFQKEKLTAAGLPADFVPVQHNISYNRERGVTRGFHAEPWDKYVSVISGRIFAVFVDLRAENFGKKFEVEINPTKAIYVPRGVANSFQTLEETYYSYMVNAHWQPNSADKYKFVNLADPDLNVQWPVPLAHAIVSDKDKIHPMLKDVKSF
jgi:dTDP-4-dehydrorhamnose 3,5-epimerase